MHIEQRADLDANLDAAIADMFGDQAENCCEDQCNKKIPKDLAVKHRLMFVEMNKAEQDAVILSHLQQCRRAVCMQESYDDHTQKGFVQLRPGSDTLQRIDVTYMFCGLPICKAMYLFLHDVGNFRYKALCKHFDVNGISPRVHKSANKTPARDNVVPPEIIEEVVKFIKTFADNFGLPLPGRMPNFKNYDIIKLPSMETKSSIYRKYCVAISTRKNARIIARTTFSTIWNKYCPYVTITKPADDLCGTCRNNQIDIKNSANLNEEEKQMKLNAAKEHLDRARIQREYYNKWRELAARKEYDVFSFDFAENLTYPFCSQQVGPSYFKTPRKCGLFGVHNEGTHYQENFLIDESDSIGKGANTVISLLRHFLESLDQKDTLVFFADNATGQNKNNAVLQYFLWRVLTGKNRKILYNFLVSGHTKFSPDRSFGILKKKYSRSTVDTIIDLKECVKSSSHKGLQGATITLDPRTNEHQVIWSDWTSFLDQLFVKLPGLTKYHHFIFTSDGAIKTKEYADSEPECVYLVKSDWTADAALVIEDIIPEGLSVERQWYLFENVRQFVIDEAKKDLVTPKPSLPKPPKAKNGDLKNKGDRNDAENNNEEAITSQSSTKTTRGRGRGRGRGKQSTSRGQTLLKKTRNKSGKQ